MHTREYLASLHTPSVRAPAEPGGAPAPAAVSRVRALRHWHPIRAVQVVAGMCEIAPIALLPDSWVQYRLLRPMRTAVHGTIVAGELAYHAGCAHIHLCCWCWCACCLALLLLLLLLLGCQGEKR